MTTNTGCKLVLKYATHVPDICLNPASTDKIDDATWSTTLVAENGSSQMGV